jgi:hypothetical protein
MNKNRRTIDMAREGLFRPQSRVFSLRDILCYDRHNELLYVTSGFLFNTGNEGVWGVYKEKNTGNGGAG